jgi:hypothetical protein
VGRIRKAVEIATPRHSKVAVISKGDDKLLQLGGRQGWHFPQDDHGGYAGYYPGDSTAAITHLETLRVKGANYLVLPSTALWWLDCYGEFRQHLMQHYQVVVEQKDTCLIFALRAPVREPSTALTIHQQEHALVPLKGEIS